MPNQFNRRAFVGTSLTAGFYSGLPGLSQFPASANEQVGKPLSVGRLVLNDDGHVFLNLSGDLRKDHL